LFALFGDNCFNKPEATLQKNVRKIIYVIYIERFNRSFREEVLNPHLFANLNEVREISWVWRLSYNEERPHQSLGNIPPAEFKRQLNAENSSLELCA